MSSPAFKCQIHLKYYITSLPQPALTPPTMSLTMLLDASRAIEAAQGLVSMSTCPQYASQVSTEPEEALRLEINRMPYASGIEGQIPRNFMVKEIPRKSGTRSDKYYYSPEGECFRSVKAVLRSLE